MKTPYHDDDGVRIKENDWVSFSYGIPPVHVKGKIGRDKKYVLTVFTPGHSPESCRLSELRYFVGSFYKHTP